MFISSSAILKFLLNSHQLSLIPTNCCGFRQSPSIGVRRDLVGMHSSLGEEKTWAPCAAALRYQLVLCEVECANSPSGGRRSRCGVGLPVPALGLPW